MTGIPLLDFCIGTVSLMVGIVSLLTALSAHRRIKQERKGKLCL